MRSKDQILLEKAYSKILEADSFLEFPQDDSNDTFKNFDKYNLTKKQIKDYNDNQISIRLNPTPKNPEDKLTVDMGNYEGFVITKNEWWNHPPDGYTNKKHRNEPHSISSEDGINWEFWWDEGTLHGFTVKNFKLHDDFEFVDKEN